MIYAQYIAASAHNPIYASTLYITHLIISNSVLFIRSINAFNWDVFAVDVVTIVPWASKKFTTLLLIRSGALSPWYLFTIFPFWFCIHLTRLMILSAASLLYLSKKQNIFLLFTSMSNNIYLTPLNVGTLIAPHISTTNTSNTSSALQSTTPVIEARVIFPRKHPTHFSFVNSLNILSFILFNDTDM